MLASPPAHAGNIDISEQVAQRGANAGVRNTIFTRWLAAGEAVSGLSGTISLSGNAAGFDEALVLLGTSDMDRSACSTANGTAVPAIPGLRRLWAGILKSNDPAPVSIPVAVPLDPALGRRTLAGSCLVSVVSAGYPFLRRDRPLYAKTELRLSVRTAPVASGQLVRTFGIGGEFRFPLGSSRELATYVGLRAARTLLIDGLAVSLSAAPVSGAPAQAGWGPALSGSWRVSTDFLLLQAAACDAALLHGHAGDADFSVLRLGRPAELALPRGATTLVRAPMSGTDMNAAQLAGYHAFSPPLRLRSGDCLLAVEHAGRDGSAGSLDVENQSTLYIRSDP